MCVCVSIGPIYQCTLLINSLDAMRSIIDMIIITIYLTMPYF